MVQYTKYTFKKICIFYLSITKLLKKKSRIIFTTVTKILNT